MISYQLVTVDEPIGCAVSFERHGERPLNSERYVPSTGPRLAIYVLLRHTCPRLSLKESLGGRSHTAARLLSSLPGAQRSAARVLARGRGGRGAPRQLRGRGPRSGSAQGAAPARRRSRAAEAAGARGQGEPEPRADPGARAGQLRPRRQLLRDQARDRDPRDLRGAGPAAAGGREPDLGLRRPARELLGAVRAG